MLDKHKVIESERLCKAKGVQFINIELASQFQCTVDDIRQLSSSATNKHLYNPTQHQGQHPCEFCILEFDSTWALSAHQLSAHTDEYHRKIEESARPIKARWSEEETHLLAVKEAEFRMSNLKLNLNQELAVFFPERTVDAIKSHRRQAQYRILVNQLVTTSPPQQSLDQDCNSEHFSSSPP